MTIGEFAEAVATYCYLQGGSVTSWGRSRKHNHDVGGVPQSAHQYFRGADVVYDDKLLLVANPGNVDVAARLGLKLLAEGDHDHLQPMDWIKG